MFFEILLITLALALSVTGSLTFWPVTNLGDFYKPLILLIGGYICINIILFILFILCSFFYSKKKQYKKPRKFANFIMSNMYEIVLNRSRARIKIIGKARLPRKTRFLLVCNHRSNFDPFIVGAKLGKYNISFITKESNFKYPFANKYMSALCYMPIDRNDKLQSLEVMKKASSLIKNNYASVCVFPEGTRQTKNIIGPFHEGVFNIAIREKCPIVVASIFDAHDICKKFPCKSTKIFFRFLTVIYPEEYEGQTAKWLSDNIHEMMEEEIKDEISSVY